MQFAPIKEQENDLVLSDRRLVERCLAGDQAAWDDLYEQCQPTIISTAMAALNHRGDAREISDEIAARVWLQLVSNDCRVLERFDAQRGCRLQTFVAKICRYQTFNYQRAERRRRAWEVLVADSEHLECRNATASSHAYLVLPESFLASLTIREREFCEKYLFQARDLHQPPEYSPSNVRQLRCRLRRKLQAYLEGNS
jgi:hypothetical protein